MLRNRSWARCVPGLLLFVGLLVSGRASAQAVDPSARQLVNQWELYRELRVDPERQAMVPEYFPSFLEYQDLALFHPVVGYYSSGRVDFYDDYQTFPSVLAPRFGEMVANQIFRMWQGMREAGTLKAGDRFTIAELGPGDGTLAETILNYITKRGTGSGAGPWADFYNQVVYACYDRSPALSEAQARRNARFGDHFSARVADATDLTATIAPGSLKGVLLSNELYDAFSVHKVLISADGSAEVAFVVPVLPASRWESVSKNLTPELVKRIEAGDREVEDKIIGSEEDSTVYLTRDTFVALLEGLPERRYVGAMRQFQFREVYVPASLVPEVADHLDRYADMYAGVLARRDGGLITYINLGVERMLRGAGEILDAGYVMTIDYGSNWEGILEQTSSPHLRTYGPANRSVNEPRESGVSYEEWSDQNVDTYDPYVGPTLNDLTTDVNFSLMSAAGDAAGLRTVFYGYQRSLQPGTGISFTNVPAFRASDDDLFDEFEGWVAAFKGQGTFKLLVQQKEGTDAAYEYPDDRSLPLGLSEKDLTEVQQARFERLRSRMSALIPAPVAQ